MYDKMNRFLPPANDWSLETEFECWHPDASFAFGEPDGTISWRGAGLPAIEADGSLPFVDLPKQLQEMISHCWKKAVVPTSPRANPPMLGGARQQAFKNRGLQPGASRSSSSYGGRTVPADGESHDSAADLARSSGGHGQTPARRGKRLERY